MSDRRETIMEDMNLQNVRYRDYLLPSDSDKVYSIVRSSGFFSPQEINVAVELVKERETKGPSSGYFFLFAEMAGDVAGYTCFGPIPCTEESYDIYWIAVSEPLRRLGLGRELLRRTEEKITEMGGRRIYVETSSRAQYQPTHAFYRRSGYGEAAILEHFYSPDDHKIIFLKVLA
jgi:ribosomal protein S18 acetylase RimI-like enzyme